MTNPCHICGDAIAPRRSALGYTLCMQCGEETARGVRHCAVPLSKSNYVYVSPASRGLLAQLNPKRTG